MRGDVRKGPGARALAQRWAGLRGRDEGQIGLLVLGMTIIAILLILTTAAITAVSLARMRLLDAADSAALQHRSCRGVMVWRFFVWRPVGARVRMSSAT